MPLSEHEQRLLDQIERALYQEDPKFASTVKSTDLRTHMRRRLRRAAAVLVVGFVILFTGLIAFEGRAGQQRRDEGPARGAVEAPLGGARRRALSASRPPPRS